MAGFGILVMSLILGISFFGAQEPATAQTTGGNSTSPQPTATIANFNAAGYEATPVPKPHHHKHKNVMTDNKIPNEGVQPGHPLPGENPQLTVAPVNTVAATPDSH